MTLNDQPTREGEGNKIRLFLADNHPVMRRGIALIIQGEPDMQVVGDVGDGLATVEGVLKLHPDVVLMEIDIPGLPGVEVTERIANGEHPLSVLLFTAHDRGDSLFRSLAAGAKGYVLKNTGVSVLLDAIRTVHAGEMYISPAMTTKLARGYLARARSFDYGDEYESLTARERAVLPVLTEEGSDRNIAAQLHLSPHTVQAYRKRIMKKLNLHSKTGLLRYVLRKGLVDLDS